MQRISFEWCSTWNTADKTSQQHCAQPLSSSLSAREHYPGDRKVESGLSWQAKVFGVSGQSGAMVAPALSELAHLLSDSVSSSVHGMTSIWTSLRSIDGNSALHDKQFLM